MNFSTIWTILTEFIRMCHAALSDLVWGSAVVYWVQSCTEFSTGLKWTCCLGLFCCVSVVKIETILVVLVLSGEKKKKKKRERNNNKNWRLCVSSWLQNGHWGAVINSLFISGWDFKPLFISPCSTWKELFSFLSL